MGVSSFGGYQGGKAIQAIGSRVNSEDIFTLPGFTTSQVDDMLKYTGKSLDEFSIIVRNGELELLLGIPDMNLNYLAKLTGKSTDEITDWLKKNNMNLNDINAGNVDDVIKGASGVRSLFDKGKDVFKKFNLNDAYVKPKHLSTSGGNGAKFLGGSKVESEVILREGLRNGTIKTIADNGITKLGSQSYEILIDAGKVIGTKGETLIKVVLSEDGGMISAYPVK